MQTDRVAQVFVGEDGRGSGYLVAPTLVLTAAHVIGTADAGIEIRTIAALRNGDRSRVAAKLLMRDDDRDLALLEIPASLSHAPLLFGTLGGRLPIPVDAVGFPDVTLRDGKSDTMAVTGECHPDSGLLHGRLPLRVSSLVPQRREDWAGLSGAAVFAGSYLIGVMRSVPAAFQSGALEAAAIAPWLKDSAVAAILRTAGADSTAELIDADVVRPFGTAGFDAAADRYRAEVLASFRLDGTGLGLDGASGHAIALDRAYAGTRYELRRKREPFTALATEQRIVLLGAPGTGKSVTLKRLLAAVSHRDGRIPVFMRLGDLGDLRDEMGDITVATFMHAFAERAAKLGVPEADVRLFARLSAHGQIVIGLDGFDEIGGRASRERMAAAIGRLSDAAPNARIIVASRPSEFRESPLPKPTKQGVAEFEEVQTLPLEGEEGGEFLRICFGDDGSLWRLIRAKQELRELARTPLLLTMLAILGKRGTLPDQIGDILAKIVKTALESWESSKVEKERLPAAARARQALEDLAFIMHQRETAAAPISLAQAQRTVGDADETLLDWLVNRTGLLIRSEQRGATTTRPVVQFVHLQLQEYLAGRALARHLAANDDKGWNAVRTWGAHSAWTEPQTFAARELASGAEPDVLEKWVAAIVASLAIDGPSDDDKGNAALLAAQLLAQADPEFLPAHEVEASLVAALESRGAGYGRLVRVAALCALAPRPQSLAAVRDIAFQTPIGLRWLARTDVWPDGSNFNNDLNDAIATSIMRLCVHGTDADARKSIRWVVQYARQFARTAPWASLSMWVEKYLRDLAFSEPGLERSEATDVVELLDTIELAGHVRHAREFSIEGAARSASERSTAGFVQWLEAHADAEGLLVVDAYYDRLRALLAAHHGDYSQPWHSLPIWPSRDSAAAHAVREEALRNQTAAWFIVRDAMRDSRYTAQAVDAWRAIMVNEPDRSRRLGLISRTIEELDDDIAIPLLLDALASATAGPWGGERIVWHLRTRGHGDDVRLCLLTAVHDPATSLEHKETLYHLLEVLDA